MELNLISMLMFCNNLSYFFRISVFQNVCFTSLFGREVKECASLGYLFLTVFDFDWERKK